MQRCRFVGKLSLESLNPIVLYYYFGPINIFTDDRLSVCDVNNTVDVLVTVSKSRSPFPFCRVQFLSSVCRTLTLKNGTVLNGILRRPRYDIECRTRVRNLTALRIILATSRVVDPAHIRRHNRTIVSSTTISPMSSTNGDTCRRHLVMFENYAC